MILKTASNHFGEDIQRAKNLLNHAKTLHDGILKDDIHRASWMMAVGALDAFFCDAYGDLIARTLRAKRIQPSATIPDKLQNLKIPIIVVLDNHLNEPWLWRMVARDLIEKDNVLSIDKIKTLFNQFFSDDEKLFNERTNSIDRWLLHRDSKFRLFGVNKTEYRNSVGRDKGVLKRKALEHLEDRFELIFQRRHDCIHNCDRPKIAPQPKQIQSTYVEKVIVDIEFLVLRCLDEFRNEFPKYLTRHGFNSVTRNRVGV